MVTAFLAVLIDEVFDGCATAGNGLRRRAGQFAAVRKSAPGPERQFTALQRPQPLSRVMRTYQGRRWSGPKKAIMAVAVIHTRTERQGGEAISVERAYRDRDFGP